MKKSKGLSLPVIIIISIILSSFSIASFLLFGYVRERWAPSSENADKFLKRRKYSKAMAIINQNENSDKNIPLLLEKGRIWMTLAWENENKEGWANYGVNDKEWLKSKESDSSVACFKRVLQLDSDNRDALYYLGIIYMDKGWYSAAQESFMDVLDNNKNDFETRNLLGVLYTRMRQYPQALREFQAAWKLKDNDISVAKNLGSLYRLHLNRPDSAMVWMNRYLNMNPKRDPDAGRIRRDLSDMIKRYPEYRITEPMDWYGKRDFTARGEEAFQFKKKD